MQMIETSFNTHWKYNTASGAIFSDETNLRANLVSDDGRKWTANFFYLVRSVSFGHGAEGSFVTFHYGKDTKLCFPAVMQNIATKTQKGIKRATMNMADKTLQLTVFNVKLTGEVLDKNMKPSRSKLADLSKTCGSVSRCSLEFYDSRLVVRVSFKLHSNFIVLPVAYIM